MEEKELKAKDIPWEYALCFNSECENKDKCMHYQARLLMPEDRYYGPAVYPTAWENGECRCFREKKLVKKAWGSHISMTTSLSGKRLRLAGVCMHYSVAVMGRTIGCIMVRICSRL